MMKKVQVTIKMVLHTIIGEYDVLYAQNRELSGSFPDKHDKHSAWSADPADHLSETSLSAAYTVLTAENIYRKGRR